MDFWAQHKDFVLKALAGFGVFLVCLIARGITYGDELEKEQTKNKTAVAKVKRLKIASIGEIQKLEENAKRLASNAGVMTTDIGWSSADENLEQALLERILRYTRQFRGENEGTVREYANRARQAIRDDLNGGFGQLRLMVRDELVEEAGEKNIKVAKGLGYDNVVELEDGELMKYLLQLELTARVARYAIDEGIAIFDQISITTRVTTAPIPDANPEFLQEYAVIFEFSGTQDAVTRLINRLDSELPRVPIRKLQLDRRLQPADQLDVKLTAVAVAANADVAFLLEEKPQ